MKRIVGRVHQLGMSNAIILRMHERPALRIGDRFWLAPDEHGCRTRHGELEVETVTDDGCVFTIANVHTLCPAAAIGDYLVIHDREQPWSPYP